MLGLDSSSRTSDNLQRTGQCVVNLPSAQQVAAVDRLARTTGTDPVPGRKLRRGYRFAADKFGLAGLTPVAAETVAPSRALQCPVQMEAVLAGQYPLAQDDEQLRGGIMVFEVRVQRVHVDESIRMAGEPDRIDPDKWRPLIMSFQKYYGLGSAQLAPSTLADIPEQLYRSPDIDRSRRVQNTAG